MTTNNRYHRQILLDEIGVQGQQALKNASVLVVGAGGLGVPVLTYLNAAGVGTIGIVDGDKVCLSNLHRQVLYTEDDIGKNKAWVAQKRLEERNSETEIYSYAEYLSEKNADNLFSSYDIIVDGTDNIESRYIINDVCKKLGKPFVYGAIHRFEGHVSVFNLKYSDGSYGPDYRDLYPDITDTSVIPTCVEAGVIGTLPGIIGMMQANETVKIITGIGDPLSGKLWIFDTLSHDSFLLNFGKSIDEKTRIKSEEKDNIPEIEWEKAQHLKENILWVDIRERHENREIQPAESLHIPFSEFVHQPDKVPLDDAKTIILYCGKGIRSRRAVNILRKSISNTGNEIYSLKHGTQIFNKTELYNPEKS